MNLKEIMQWRYATKVFDKNKKVPEETLNRILELTNLSATSFGLQPYKTVLVSNQKLKEELVKHSYNQSNIANSSHLVVFASNTNIDKNYVDDFLRLTAETRNIELSSLDNFRKMLHNFIAYKDDKSIAEWSALQVYLALGTFLVACADEKVDACPIGGFVPDAYDEVLQLEKYNLHSVVVAAVGYRDESDKYQYLKKIRKSADEMIIRID